jgi:hypothetical protein
MRDFITDALFAGEYLANGQQSKKNMYVQCGRMLSAIADQIDATNCGAIAKNAMDDARRVAMIGECKISDDGRKIALKTIKNTISMYVVYFDGKGRGPEIRKLYSTFKSWCRASLSVRERSSVGRDVKEKVVEAPLAIAEVDTDPLSFLKNRVKVVSQGDMDLKTVQHVLLVLTGQDFTKEQIGLARLADAPQAAVA